MKTSSLYPLSARCTGVLVSSLLAAAAGLATGSRFLAFGGLTLVAATLIVLSCIGVATLWEKLKDWSWARFVFSSDSPNSMFFRGKRRRR